MKRGNGARGGYSRPGNIEGTRRHEAKAETTVSPKAPRKAGMDIDQEVEPCVVGAVRRGTLAHFDHLAAKVGGNRVKMHGVDAHADRISAVLGDLDGDGGLAARRLSSPRFTDEPRRDQVGDDIGDRLRCQAGRAREFGARHGPGKSQSMQQDASIVTPDVAGVVGIKNRLGIAHRLP